MNRQKLKVDEMDYLRNSRGVPRLESINNEKIRGIMELNKMVVEERKERVSRFICYEWISFLYMFSSFFDVLADLE